MWGLLPAAGESAFQKDPRPLPWRVLEALLKGPPPGKGGLKCGQLSPDRERGGAIPGTPDSVRMVPPRVPEELRSGCLDGDRSCACGSRSRLPIPMSGPPSSLLPPSQGFLGAGGGLCPVPRALPRPPSLPGSSRRLPPLRPAAASTRALPPVETLKHRFSLAFFFFFFNYEEYRLMAKKISPVSGKVKV